MVPTTFLADFFDLGRVAAFGLEGPACASVSDEAPFLDGAFFRDAALGFAAFLDGDFKAGGRDVEGRELGSSSGSLKRLPELNKAISLFLDGLRG